jgi:hypothetical protein
LLSVRKDELWNRELTSEVYQDRTSSIGMTSDEKDELDDGGLKQETG